MTTDGGWDTLLRGVPLWLVREYLVELGGRVEGERHVAGNGWDAHLSQAEDYRIGSLSVGQVQLRLSGDADRLAALRPALEKKLIRAGG